MFQGFQHHVSLRKWNTFGIEAKAEHLAAFADVETLREAVAAARAMQLPITVLGGGSNMLLTKDVSGVVLKNELKGLKVVAEDEMSWTLEAAAGENWHETVMHCVLNEYAGVENLALIPGCVGAGPMQNIGAYGVELKDVFHSLTAYHLYEDRFQDFSLEECAFGYRESIFKRKEKGNWIITAVRMRLLKRPVFHTNYGAIEEELDKMNLDRLSIKSIAQAVINIRSSKLPDPKVLGNAGSFFKNPVVPMEVYQAIKAGYPNVPAYPINEQEVKVPAGWLIEQCGWKGKRTGECGVHDKQALVLVNYGGATGSEIYALSENILQDVQARFSVQLEREVNIL